MYSYTEALMGATTPPFEYHFWETFATPPRSACLDVSVGLREPREAFCSPTFWACLKDPISKIVERLYTTNMMELVAHWFLVRLLRVLPSPNFVVIIDTSYSLYVHFYVFFDQDTSCRHYCDINRILCTNEIRLETWMVL